MPGTAIIARPARSNARWYVLEGVNALSSTYYLNYLYFYLRDHFGFGNRDNLLVTVLHGFLYTLSAWYAGRFAHRFGHLFTLRLGFAGMGLAMAVIVNYTWETLGGLVRARCACVYVVGGLAARAGQNRVRRRAITAGADACQGERSSYTLIWGACKHPSRPRR